MSGWDSRDLYRSYRYADHVPVRGLERHGRPALSDVDPAAVHRYVLLMVRDPLCGYADDPATQVARRLDEAQRIGQSGMFTVWSGRHEGVGVTVVSGGSGSPEAELILHELIEFTDADAFIRVGGSAGVHPRALPGDIVITTGVVRDEGMTQAYIPAAYPGVAHADIVLAMARAARDLGVPHHRGITRSVDSDFVAVGRPGVGAYFQPWHAEVQDIWARAGVLNSDRESAAVVTLAALFGRRGGSVCSVADNLIAGAAFEAGAGHASAMDVVLAGLVHLDAMDHETDARGLPAWVPDIR